MKVKELKNILEQHSCLNDPDAEVVVRLSEPSIGPVAASDVKGAGFGFDWDKGRFLIYPKKPLATLKEKEALYQLSYDFIYMLSQEKTPKGNPTSYAKRAQAIRDAAKKFEEKK